MFSTLVDGVQNDIAVLKGVLKEHDAHRAALIANPPDPKTGALAPHTPKKIELQVFDHCAAFTRIYAIFEQFIEQLVTDFLQVIPDIYPTYSDLPSSIRVQHRVAVGQILQKWSEEGPFSRLTELGVVRGLADGLAQDSVYSLLPDAFLIDPQNYRPETVRKIFGYLGIVDCWTAIRKSPSMINFIRDHRDATETPETILKDIVDRRNEAAHSVVQNVVALEEIYSYADFVPILSESLASVVKRLVLQRRFELKQVIEVGKVLEVFGKPIGVYLNPGRISINDELLVVHGKTFTWTKVQSIRKVKDPYTDFRTARGEELGLMLDKRVRVGSIFYRIVVPAVKAVPQCGVDQFWDGDGI